MNRLKTLIIATIFCFTVNAYAQDDMKNYELSGHLETLHMVWIQDFDSAWQSMNTIYNRLDFKWYPSRQATFHLGLRNLMDYGQIVTNINKLSEITPQISPYRDFVAKDEGYFDLTESWANGDSYTLYSNIDRLYLNYNIGDLGISVGRQRINWGINMVWNPNDIFNTFNYFNFDYVERPGCDAVRLQYYTGFTSSAQLAFKIDRNEDITLAGMYKFNQWNYDFQFLGGIMNDDYVAGLGWSGQIETAGFNGEATWFRPKDDFSDTTGQLVASIGGNYTFKNGLYLQASGLYNSKGTTGKAGRGNMFAMNIDISPKTLTLARYSVFGQISYPITPLIHADFSGIYNPNDKSAFIGPSLDLSLRQDISFLVTAQIFLGESGTEFGDYGKIAYMRLKWSF